MKKVIGWFILITVFLILFGGVVLQEGLYMALFYWGSACALAGLLFLGMYLINEE